MGLKTRATHYSIDSPLKRIFNIKPRLSHSQFQSQAKVDGAKGFGASLLAAVRYAS